MITLEDFVARALTVPFKDRGRDYEGWDCWGLVWVGHRDVLGMQVPSYVHEYETAGATADSRRGLNDLVSRSKSQWSEIRQPRMMDVVLLRIAGRPIHAGLVLDRRRVLHAEEKVGTVVEDLNGAMWRSRLDGFFRYVG